MSLTGVIVGTFLQMMLAYFLFMLAVFAGGGVANGGSLGKYALMVLDFSMFILPGLCVLSSAAVIYFYFAGGSANSYWWYAAPVFGAAVYIMFVFKIAA